MKLIRRLLIANRGEIAVRVIRSARALGLQTVAVYSDADRGAPHVHLADIAIRIGEPPAAASYLDIERILEAAVRSEADAIHPGYGFLSENPEFARRVAAAGLTFVGPPAEAIAVMGNKVVAKQRMIAAGVPTVPGYHGSEQTPQQLREHAAALGMPILIKAVAGGGGRGMRIVRSIETLVDGLERAASEARSAFGQGDVFLERLIEGARHVEIQVFGDSHGHVIHLGERECSVQRRHQKVIEEAPSPAVDAELRARMGDAAVAAARAVDYVGAGTVEFLLDEQGQFYFLEMNTRLQVEHPVTELVTGLDLVEWQLRIAQGQPLPLAQSQVQLCGHAIEARIYAEDPHAGFLPQAGVVERFEAPSGPGVRVDSGICTGAEVSTFYDPMLAKVIAFAGDRDTARMRLLGALREMALVGPVNNRSWLLRLLAEPAFVAGAIKTGDLDARAIEPELAPPPAIWAIAAVLVGEHASSAWATAYRGWSSSGALEFPIELACQGERRGLRLTRARGGQDLVWNVRGEGEDRSVAIAIAGSDAMSTSEPIPVECDGRRWKLTVAHHDDGVEIQHQGSTWRFCERSARADPAGGAPADASLVAPMGGRVLAVSRAAGDPVVAGECVAVIEAMKMEHRVVSPRAGTLVAVSVREGDQVRARQVIAVLASEGQENP